MGNLARSGRATDRRHQSRHICYLPIRFFPDGYGGEWFSLPARNIAREGLFVESALLFDVGDLFDVEFDLPGRDLPLRARAQVARVRSSTWRSFSGMALKLVGLSDHDRNDIESLAPGVN